MTTLRGFTLVEMLVALAVGSLVLSMAFATIVSSRRFNTVLDARATVGQRDTAIPRLLADVLGLAGRAREGCGLHVAPGGLHVAVVGTDVGDTAATTVSIFAGRDGGGRPALYHRTLPYPRQPWLEDVVEFRVVDARDDAGVWRPLIHDATTRWGALRVTLLWTDHDVRTYELPLPHAPCAEALP
jgi:prepilin-type N-terminal cleavage/methylation domain-containing protein